MKTNYNIYYGNGNNNGGDNNGLSQTNCDRTYHVRHGDAKSSRLGWKVHLNPRSRWWVGLHGYKIIIYSIYFWYYDQNSNYLFSNAAIDWFIVFLCVLLLNNTQPWVNDDKLHYINLWNNHQCKGCLLNNIPEPHEHESLHRKLQCLREAYRPWGKIPQCSHEDCHFGVISYLVR